MKVEIKGIHLEVTDRIRGYLDAKLPRLDFAKDLIIDLLISLTKEKNLFKAEATVNFRWGSSRHVGVEGFDLDAGIDEMVDKLEAVLTKEKSRVKEHHHRGAPPRDAT
jgi:putative sigma-54 modulation protein